MIWFRYRAHWLLLATYAQARDAEADARNRLAEAHGLPRSSVDPIGVLVDLCDATTSRRR